MTENTAETTAESPAVGSEVIVEQTGANGGMTRPTIATVLKARVVLEDGHRERFTAAASTRRACSSTAASSAGTARAAQPASTLLRWASASVAEAGRT
jgi:hypothetical protein